MNHTFSLYVVLTLALITACAETEDKTVSGIIIDGTMNTLMVETSAKDTLCFSTMDADRSEINGMRIGDTATVRFQAKAISEDPPLYAATRVTVKQTAPSLEGNWTEPVPGMETLSQGISLSSGGKASSINMATLVYESWRQEGDSIVLSGKSIGNGQTIEFTEQYRIDLLTADSLRLVKNDYTIRYARVR